jgi:hypothetical protein
MPLGEKTTSGLRYSRFIWRRRRWKYCAAVVTLTRCMLGTNALSRERGSFVSCRKRSMRALPKRSGHQRTRWTLSKAEISLPRVLRSCAIVTVREQEGHRALHAPFRLATAEERVEHDLSPVVEVSELKHHHSQSCSAPSRRVKQLTCASQIGSSLGVTHATPCSNPTTAYSERELLTTSKVPTAFEFAPEGGDDLRVSSGTTARSDFWSVRIAWRCENVPCFCRGERFSGALNGICENARKVSAPFRCLVHKVGRGSLRGAKTRTQALRPWQSRALHPFRAIAAVSPCAS